MIQLGSWFQRVWSGMKRVWHSSGRQESSAETAPIVAHQEDLRLKPDPSLPALPHWVPPVGNRRSKPVGIIPKSSHNKPTCSHVGERVIFLQSPLTRHLSFGFIIFRLPLALLEQLGL